jgi:hypothetical protein
MSNARHSATLPTDVDVLIVGAGHAGLAMSGYLGQARREHLVIDRRDRLGGGWQDRWDEFRLVTPNWTSSFPGWAYDGSDPDGFMSRDEITARVARWARDRRSPPCRDDEPARGPSAAPGDRDDSRASGLTSLRRGSGPGGDQGALRRTRRRPDRGSPRRWAGDLRRVLWLSCLRCQGGRSPPPFGTRRRSAFRRAGRWPARRPCPCPCSRPAARRLPRCRVRRAACRCRALPAR